MSSNHTIAAIVPCHNEAQTVGGVVEQLLSAIPGIEVYVYDNLSTDGTAQTAREAGAIVRLEDRKGKGNVIRRAFADIEADSYLMVDGDGTYDIAAAPLMVKALLDGPLDHVVGVRRQTTDTAYRSGHAAGNRAFNAIVGWIFGVRVSDMLSGYRVLSRRFVKSFPMLAREFEVETELTVHAINLRVPQAEVEVGFQDRPEGSESKLRTYHDGFKILGLILRLARYERPLPFHGFLSGLLFALGLVLGLPVVSEFLETGKVPRFPTAILASSVMIISVIVLLMGIFLEALRRVRDENTRLSYLRWPAAAAGGAR